MVLQPTGRWSSDEDGGVEEDGRRRLDAEEDGRRRLDEEEERRRVAFLGGTRRDSGKRRPYPRGQGQTPPCYGLPNSREFGPVADFRVGLLPGEKAGIPAGIWGLIGSLRQPLARLTRCNLNLFGYLHEVASLTPAVQKVPTSLAPEERGNRSHAVSPAAVMQEQAWGQRPDKQK